MEYRLAKNRRQQIVYEAGHLFRNKGYNSTSMKDIAEQVDMEAASLYNHIKSKHEILSELLLYIAKRFQQGMKNIDESSYSPFEKVKALIALHIRLTTEKIFSPDVADMSIVQCNHFQLQRSFFNSLCTCGRAPLF